MIKLDFDPWELLRKALKTGGDFADFYLERSQTCSIVCEDKRLEKVISGRDAGLGVRVALQGRSSYGYSNDLSPSASLQLAELVSQGIKNGLGQASLAVGKGEMTAQTVVKKAPWEANLAEKVALVKRANDLAWGMDGRVQQVTVVFRDGAQRITIGNSEGILVSEERVSIIFLVQVVARKGELVQTGYEAKGGTLGLELFDEYSPEEVASSAVRRAMLMLEARPAPAGKMT